MTSESADPILDDDVSQNGSAAITLEHDPMGVTIRVLEDLDLSIAPQLERMLDHLDTDEPGRLLLDLDAVEFVDSTGLAAIVHAQNTADLNGYRFAVRYSSHQVQRLFELTGMLERFSRE